ncbi:MAG: ABC transporter ATP-binding protein [Planctomycetota bacterium]|nr:MAG: ABC transporter ATP-binding protein [Planctomycetota bacterium]
MNAPARPAAPPRSPEAAAASAVRLRGVSKSFVRGEARALVLDAVDLQIRPGEATFLVGPSGSGKTTLLSIIGCVLTPDAGAVEVLGRDVRRLNRSQIAALRRREIGFIFQRMHLIRGLTALENVCVPLKLSGWRAAASRRRGLELLAAVGLADRADDNPARMSVGQCQRIALARALAADPALVLADEPTASLDAETGRTAIDLLRRTTVMLGKTLIVVTHDHRILHFADRVIAVEQGRLREQLPSASREALEAAAHGSSASAAVELRLDCTTHLGPPAGL